MPSNMRAGGRTGLARGLQEAKAMRARLSMSIVFLAASACGGGEPTSLTPLETCQRRAAINCAKAYECLDEPELELLGFPAASEDCLAQASLACEEEPEAEFCADGEIYDPVSAATCMAASGEATCEQIFGEREEEYAAACADMCRPPA
jgi:hypothetical protein